MKIKDPTAPATDPQKHTIAALRSELNISDPGESLETLTKGEASALISQLFEMKDAAKAAKPAAPKQSLTAMAAALTGTIVEDEAQIPAHTLKVAEAITATAGQPVMAITVEQANTLLSWFPIVAGETDPTVDDLALEATLQAFVNPVDNSAMIAEALAQLPAAKATQPADQVPAGHYAVTGEDGTTDFYRVEYGKAGSKWEGFLFLSQQLSDDYVAVKATPVKKAIMAKIAADGPLAAAQRYGQELGVCGVCHKTLTDPESIADGIGPVCKAKLSL